MKWNLFDKIKNLSQRTKRIMALSVCVLLLGLAIVQNLSTESGSEAQIGEDTSVSGDADTLVDLIGVSKIEDEEEYFAGKRLHRLNQQSALADEYESVMEDQSADKDTIAEAQSMLASLDAVMTCENDLESQIKSLGYVDVFAELMSDGMVDITVLAESLSEADVQSIAIIAEGLTQSSMDRITIRGVREIN
ncbi:MAG: SpoIIIAH-like family protein [Clostridia bacterium]|nr:SpoIIIAH-like family protein [Clostridia bacterium]